MPTRGRPRSFDRTQALERAMTVFWERGYEACSMRDIAQATGLGPASLYAAFGSKAALYTEALARYESVESTVTTTALATHRTAKDSIRALLSENAVAYTRAERPRGCMVVLGASTVPEAEVAVRDVIRRSRMETRDAIAGRLRQAVEEGELAPSTPVGSVADLVYTVLEGLALAARADAPVDQLLAVVERLVGAWDAIAPPADR